MEITKTVALLLDFPMLGAVYEKQELIERLELHFALEEALQQGDDGDTIPHEEMVERAMKWTAR